MNSRIIMKEVNPGAYELMYAFTKQLNVTKLTPIEKELVKIRASQINNCAYCLDLHIREAIAIGETGQRINALNAWRDTNLFTGTERAILALTEEVTLICQGVSDETYNEVASFFDAYTVSQLIMVIVQINAWNRIALATGMKPSQC